MEYIKELLVAGMVGFTVTSAFFSFIYIMTVLATKYSWAWWPVFFL